MAEVGAEMGCECQGLRAEMGCVLTWAEMGAEMRGAGLLTAQALVVPLVAMGLRAWRQAAHVG